MFFRYESGVRFITARQALELRRQAKMIDRSASVGIENPQSLAHPSSQGSGMAAPTVVQLHPPSSGRQQTMTQSAPESDFQAILRPIKGTGTDLRNREHCDDDDLIKFDLFSTNSSITYLEFSPGWVPIQQQTWVTSAQGQPRYVQQQQRPDHYPTTSQQQGTPISQQQETTTSQQQGTTTSQQQETTTSQQQGTT
ncbi:unnamed protein product, partial [Cyprideis torosa]